MRSFRVGDKVKYVGGMIDVFKPIISYGKEYIVTSTYYSNEVSNWMIEIMNDENKLDTWGQGWFRLCAPREKDTNEIEWLDRVQQNFKE